MDSIKKVLIVLVFFMCYSPGVFSQNELKFGDRKINIPGDEICSYTVNKNSHVSKHYLDIQNGIFLYTIVEFEQGEPVHIEITEGKMDDLDKSSCSIGVSDQKSAYTPGQIYVIYLYTIRDNVSISTTVYDSPDSPATIHLSSVGRIHFKNYAQAQTCFDQNFK